jgi:hypothetical protein
MEPQRLFWTLVAVHLLVACYGFALNDEADQIAALHNLAQGSLRVEEVPPSAYQVFDNITWQRRWDDRPVASTPLNLLALPVLAGIRVMAFVAPLGVWFAGLAAVAIWRSIGWRITTAEGSPAPVLGVVAIGLVLGHGLRELGPDVDYYGAAIALNVTGIILGVIGSMLAWRLLGVHVTGAWRGILLAALVAGPWLYWSRLAKYHLLTAVFVLLILLALTSPRTRRRQLILGALVGLTYWTHFAVGLVALLAVGTLELRWLLAGQTQGAARFEFALLSGLFIGALPSLLENQYLFGNPLFNFYFAGASPTNATTSNPDGAWWTAIWSTLERVPQIASQLLHWNGPQDFALNLFSILTFGGRVEGQASGFLFICPLLVLLAARGLYRFIRSSDRPDHVVWAIAFLAWQAILGTNAGVVQGAGYDPRLWFHIWPLLALLSAYGVPSHQPREAAPPIVLGLAVVTFILLGMRLIATAGFQFDHGPAQAAEYVLMGTRILAVLAVAVAVVILSLKPAWRTAGIVISVGFLLAVPMSWSALYVVGLHPRLPDTDQIEGGTMLVPLSAAASDFVYHSLAPITAKPFVWNENGTLVFHPDYGNCLVTPTPCPLVEMPPELRRRLDIVANQTVTEQRP